MNLESNYKHQIVQADFVGANQSKENYIYKWFNYFGQENIISKQVECTYLPYSPDSHNVQLLLTINAGNRCQS